MNRCDWRDCSLEVGLFDGAVASLLNTAARKNIPVNRNRFISLCPNHFELGVTNPMPAKIRINQPKRLAIVIILVIVTIIYLLFPGS